MRKPSATLALAIVASSCASGPKPRDVVGACSLDEKDAWSRLAHAPPESRFLVDRLREDTPFARNPSSAPSSAFWFRSRSGARLAYCELDIGPSCIEVWISATFHKENGSWEEDKEMSFRLSCP